MLSTLVFATMLATQQQPGVQLVNMDYTRLSGRIEGGTSFKVGEPIKLTVYVRDIDVKVLHDPKTGKHHAESYVSGGRHKVVIDQKRTVGGFSKSAESFSRYVEQDQISVKEIGWDSKKEWYSYEITVTIDPEGLPDMSLHAVHIEVQDLAVFEWNRDKPLHLSTALTLTKE